VTAIAILGAGNGGQAAAAHLSLEGHSIRLFERFPEIVEPFIDSRRITIRGAISGTATVDVITNDLGEAVHDADVILVTVPGFALSWMASELARHLHDGQIVVLHPGGTGGALEVHRTWTESRLAADVVLAETETLVYACRLTAPGAPDVKAIKREVGLAALPAHDLDPAYAAFSALFPQARPRANVLETGLANMNAVIHPAVSMLNAGPIDRHLSGFDFYGEGVTPAVGRVLKTIDGERMAVAEAFGVAHDSLERWVETHYGTVAPTLNELFEQLAAGVYQGIGTPDGLHARYLSEDVPMALVLIESLASLVAVDTPTISALITLGGALNETDYRTNGRTLARLGLRGLSREDILEFVGGAGGATAR
jgi:opine dehydrogenase